VDYRHKIYSKYRTVQRLNLSVDPKLADLWGRAYDSWFKDWLPANKSASIADIACGSGLLLRFFSIRGFTNCIGVDLSTEQLEVAKKLGLNVQLEEATAFLERHSIQYDLIVALDLIEHLKKEELLEFIDACYSALRPGGRLILQTPNCSSPFGASQRFSDFTHEIGLTPKSLTWVLRLSGFKEIVAREQGPIVHGFKSFIRFTLWNIVKLGFILFDLIETGSSERVYTRVFIISAIKPLV
jgi:2-polyprenyl-3-methyl-5-hydroxy-6-metoxy-1,4-benzoquinol methylase